MPLPRVEVLANGLTLAVEEQPWNPGVALQLLVPAGAVTDPKGMEGAASVLEGWIWKGAGKHDARSFAEAFDDLGVRRASASGLEYSTFMAQFLADKAREVFELYADLLLRPHLPDEGLEPVRQIALQELASIEDQPSKKMFTALRRAVFASPHGRNPSGSKNDLQAMTAAQLREDFANRYNPKGSILALAGGISFDEAKAMLEATLGDWKGSGVDLPAPELSQPHALQLEQDSSQVQIGLVYPEISFEHPEFYTARLAIQVLSGGSSSRLFTEVREKRGLVYSVYASPSGVKGYSYLTAYAGTTPERSDETLKVMREVIENMSEVSEDELERTKVGLRSGLVMQEESARSRVASMTRDLFSLGRVRTLEEIQTAINDIGANRINRYLSENPYKNPWIATLGPKMLVAER